MIPDFGSRSGGIGWGAFRFRTPARPPVPRRALLIDLIVVVATGLVVCLQFGEQALFFAGGGNESSGILPALYLYFDMDSMLWIKGHTLGSPVRWTSSFLLHGICLPLFGDRYFGYFVPSLLFHWLTAIALYALFLNALSVFGDSTDDRFVPGRAAGLIVMCTFLTNGSGAQYWIATLSYVLAAFTTACCVVMVLLFLRTRRFVLWGAAVALYGAALWTHSITWGLPLLFAAIEVAEWLTRRSERPAFGSMIGRYLLMAAPLAVAGSRIPGGGAFDHVALAFDGSLLGSYYEFMSNVVRAGLPLVMDARWLSSEIAGVLPSVAAIGLAAVAASAMWRHRRRGRTMGAGLAIVLSCGVWGLLTFVPIGAFADVGSIFRYYAACAGFSLGVGALFTVLLFRVVRPLGGRSRLLVVSMVTGLCCLSLLVGDARIPGGVRSITRLLPLVASGASPLSGRCAWAEPLKSARQMDVPMDECHFLADFSGADLDGAGTAGGVFLGVNFESADLRGVRFEDSLFVNCNFQDSVADSSTSFEGAYIVASRGSGMTWPGVVLRSACLFESSLEGASLVAADLRYADLSRARLTNCDLDGADVRGAVLDQTELTSTDEPVE